jgi:hypothetical protein
VSHIRISSRIYARWIACLAFSTLCLAAVVRADTVKLNDGTVVEGDILSEDETQLVINAEFASGTITEKQTLNKSDIAQVTRLTPEQKAARDMERAYRKLQQYQLDPNTSGPLSYYDQAIDDVFRPFLQQYPASPYTNAVANMISLWQADRDKVASGMGKYHGQWMNAADAARLVQEEAVHQELLQCSTLLSQRQFERTIRVCDRIRATRSEVGPQSEALDIETQAYKSWMEILRADSQRIQDEITLFEQRLDKAQQARNIAKQNLDDTTHRIQAYGQGELGTESVLHQYTAALESAEAEVLRCENELGRDRETQITAEQKIAAVKMEAKNSGLDLFSDEATAEAAAEVPPPPPGSVLDASLAWVKKNWIFAAAGGLIGLWAFSRLFR